MLTINENVFSMTFIACDSQNNSLKIACTTLAWEDKEMQQLTEKQTQV